MKLSGDKINKKITQDAFSLNRINLKIGIFSDLRAKFLRCKVQESSDLAQLKRVEVVAGLIFDQGRLLVCQRNSRGSFALKWEFPGGKLEQGEGHKGALRRELKEELGIEAGRLSELFRHEHLYPKIARINLRFFRVEDYSGELKNLVFQQIKWVRIKELMQMDFLDGDLPIVRKLVSSYGK
jgi:8-oxo-dGTP diphosphatase